MKKFCTIAVVVLATLWLGLPAAQAGSGGQACYSAAKFCVSKTAQKAPATQFSYRFRSQRQQACSSRCRVGCRRIQASCRASWAVCAARVRACLARCGC